MSKRVRLQPVKGIMEWLARIAASKTASPDLRVRAATALLDRAKKPEVKP